MVWHADCKFAKYIVERILKLQLIPIDHFDELLHEKTTVSQL